MYRLPIVPTRKKGMRPKCANKTKVTMQLNLLYANVRGIHSKLPSLKDVLHQTKASVVCITETHMNTNTGVNIDGYTLFGKPRANKKGGGVGIMVKDSLRHAVSPYSSAKSLELMWITINIANTKPLFIGVYYGLQEGVNTEVIMEEMDNLNEEIREISEMGELILCMDGNAKIGLMGEKISRNGKMLMEVFEECELIILNKQQICKGVTTRQNRCKEEEKSAIDFVVASYEASQWFQSITIDEIGDYRIRSKNDSDHNTIIANLSIRAIREEIDKGESDWNYRAAPEKWECFRNELCKATPSARTIMTRNDLSMTERYRKWEKLLYTAAFKSIGRTTKKTKKCVASKELKKLRQEKRLCKAAFEREANGIKKGILLEKYVEKQKEVISRIEEEEENAIKTRFEKMASDASAGGFWKERRALSRDDALSWLITKDDSGRRILDPEENKENIARYYEKLYKDVPFPSHPYHQQVASTIIQLTQDESRDNDTNTSENDRIPTRLEIKKAIESKKDKKATTDWKNKLLKRGGDCMVEFLMPVIRAFWTEEVAPSQWNMGVITNIWKGKGDREKLENYRGITVSSSIGTILEEIINNRLLKTVEFSQAQAGGKKGASTTDQIFILRNLMAIAKKEGRPLMVSFYDVKKAYDRANMDDMLFILNKHGFCGKVWRLTRALNVGLTAKIKTKAGLTREIKRETGGKQGGKLMVPMFAKMMDSIADDLMEECETGVSVDGVKIPALLLMDDVVAFAEGYENQLKTLKVVEGFGQKHKIEWGRDKCKVMEFGTHKEQKTEWGLGNDSIGICKSYKYLGEIISRDGKNDENLEERFKKVKCAVRAINTCGKAKIMRKIEISVLMKLHDAVTLPTLLYDSETWPLNSTTKNYIDKIEVWAWKSMLGLPKTTPTPGIMVSAGAMYASIRVQMKQLLYLQKILCRPQDHWTLVTLEALKNRQIGWAKQINEILDSWGLNPDWEVIKSKSKSEWKREVSAAAEKANKEQILRECHKKQRDTSTIKTKTKHLVAILEDQNYVRRAATFMQKNNKLIARAYIMGQYGMLQCASNFSNGYGSKLCKRCGTIDDENHRINYCPEWKGINLYSVQEKVNFENIYSADENDSIVVVKKILEIWDLGNNRNCMRETSEQ